MKKLGNLSINNEKVIKNEELISLKGGYTGCCFCHNCPSGGTYLMAGSTPTECGLDCRNAYGCARGDWSSWC